MTPTALQNFVGSSVRAKVDGQDAEALLAMDADGSLTLTSFRFITRPEQCPMIVHKLATADIHAIHLVNDHLVSSLNLQNTPLVLDDLPPPEDVCGPDSSIKEPAH